MNTTNSYVLDANDIYKSDFYTGKAHRSWSDPNIADPWLIATCLIKGSTLVTFETKNESPNKPKIPNFCAQYGIRCLNLFEMMQELGITLIDQ